MKVKLKNTYSLHDLNFDCIFFENLKENYEEMEICMYEDVFLDLNTHTTITSLLEKYSLHYFVCGLSYFGVEKELEKLSTYLQRKKTRISWKLLLRQKNNLKMQLQFLMS